ncbi:MAG: hypothetical protein ABF379_17335 [Akkermansiaceae bacterium]|jgi:uncharacterized paraquat-inducible protein A
MIVSFPDLLVVIVLLAFLWIVVDWILSTLGDRREERRLRFSARECHLCGKRYPEEKRVKLSTCPKCSARNVRGGHRKLG